MRGFTYRGTNVSRFGVKWAPQNNVWHLWNSDYRTIERVVDSQDGGQWYANPVNPKPMELSCFFEDITEYQIASVVGLFARDTHGDLVFDERPWLTYHVRPTKKIDITKYPAGNGLFSGTMTIYLMAYYPFATTDLVTIEDATAYPEHDKLVRETTGLIAGANMPTPPSMPMTAASTINLYNAGTAKADTIIRIAGDVGAGVVIHNRQTGQSCKVIKLTSDISTAANRWLEMNSRTGECWLTDGSNKSNGWLYHDRGFIQITPTTPILRDVAIEYNGPHIAVSEDMFTNDWVGRYIYVNGWKTITGVLGAREAIISTTDTAAGTTSTDIVMMNEIVITPVTAMNLSRFDIEYKHTFG